MSLINDALKRARQAQPNNSPPLAPGVPQRPVDIPRPGNAGPGLLWPLVVVAVLVVGLVTLVLWAVNRGGADRKVALVTVQESRDLPAAGATALKPIPTRSPQQPEPNPPPIVAPAVSPPGVPATPATTNATTSLPVVNPPATTNAPAVVVETPPPAIAWPKLQGIFYRSDRPSVLLNNKTVLIGEHSGEFLVVAIDQQSVTLAHAGVTNVLRMGE